MLVVKTKKAFNPFYGLLVVAGVAFGITALAYGVMMTVAQNDPVRARQAIESGRGLVALMDRHGLSLLMIELAVLAAATVLAITTDGYWQRRSHRAASQPVGSGKQRGAAASPEAESSREEGVSE